jgi:large subunit ribosomal protein L15
MEALLNLKRNKGARTTKRIIGRGNGSGRGTTCGRGEHGQKSRNGGNIKPGFTGGDTPLTRKMPKLKGFKNINHITYQAVNVESLNVFADNTEIDQNILFDKNIILKKNQPVKLLGNGDLNKKLVIKLNKISASAKEKVEKAGGTIVS